MRGIAILAALAGVPCSADPRVEAALDAALADQRVVLTCASLDPAASRLLEDQWTGMVEETVAILEGAGYDPKAIARFEDRARLEALLPAVGATFAEVAALCARAGDWRARLATLDMAWLPGPIPDLLAADP